jgi:streptogramin lyase
VVSGVVKDPSGKPIRGALVTVADGPRSIARFTDASGAYRIADAPRKALSVTASGYGFAPMSKTLTAGQAGTVDFQLPEQFNPQELTTSEILTTLPQNRETEWLKVRCISCHGLSQVARLRGATEPTWIATFKTMQLQYGREELKPEDYEYTAKAVAKYFGPNGPQPTAQSVRRAPLSDEALKATFYMIDLPPSMGRALAHSIVADNQGGAWVALAGKQANAMARWDLAKGVVETVPLKEPEMMPHTPTIDHEGRVWTGLIRAKTLSVIDPKTHKIDYVPLDSYPHTLSTDADGKIWGNGEKIFRVDPDTREIQYWTPIEAKREPGSWGDLFPAPGRPHPGTKPLDPYHSVRDSKGFAWFTSYDTGLLTRLDPRTGQQTTYKPPGNRSSRGIDVDANDIVWFSNWSDHALMRFDPKSGKFSTYKFPTEYAMPYSVFADRKRGAIWVTDFAGNHLTRFDPRTEKFVEYPLPHNQSYPRFLSIDDKGRIWFGEWWNSRLGMMDPGDAS